MGIACCPARPVDILPNRKNKIKPKLQKLYSTFESFKLGLNDLKEVKTLPEGSFGTNTIVASKRNGDLFLVKSIPKDLLSSHSIFVNRNFRIYLSSQFIVHFFKILENEQQIYSLVEYVDGFTFDSVLEKSGPLNESIVKFYAAEIILALEDLHSRNIVYRGLSLERILIDREGHLKLCNYGLYSIFFWKEGKRFALISNEEGTISPQEIHGQEVGPFSDLWALGVIIYQMLSGQREFNTREFISDGESDRELKFKNKVSKSAKELLKMLLEEYVSYV